MIHSWTVSELQLFSSQQITDSYDPVRASLQLTYRWITGLTQNELEYMATDGGSILRILEKKNNFSIYYLYEIIFSHVCKLNLL